MFRRNARTGRCCWRASRVPNPETSVALMVRGVPLWKVAMRLNCQPPRSQFSAGAAQVPKRRPRPKGNSQRIDQEISLSGIGVDAACIIFVNGRGGIPERCIACCLYGDSPEGATPMPGALKPARALEAAS